MKPWFPCENGSVAFREAKSKYKSFGVLRWLPSTEFHELIHGLLCWHNRKYSLVEDKVDAESNNKQLIKRQEKWNEFFFRLTTFFRK